MSILSDEAFLFTRDLMGKLKLINTKPSEADLVNLRDFSTEEEEDIITPPVTPPVEPEDSQMPAGYITGLGLDNNTSNTKFINIGRCRSSDDTFDIISEDSILTVDLDVSGNGGLDTGVKSSNSWYSIFVIADSTGVEPVSSLLSLSKTAPDLSGIDYDVFRRVGWMFLAAAGVQDCFYGQSGFNRSCLWEEPESKLNILVNGNNTVYTLVNCSNFIPPTPTIGYINTNHTSGDLGDFLTVAPTGLNLEGFDPSTKARANRTYSGSGTGSTFHFINFNNSDGEILYANNSTNEQSDIWIIGYIDSLQIE